MMAAKKLGMAPRQCQQQVLTHLDLNGIASKVEIVGPGFINIFLDPAFLAEHVQQALASGSSRCCYARKTDHCG